MIARDNNLPPNTDGESPLTPVPPLYNGHLTPNKGARSVEDLVRVSMVHGRLVRVVEGYAAIMRVRHLHLLTEIGFLELIDLMY
jgi:hypothetical protein